MAGGALSGAATGAAVGSVVPGLGTAIGAGVGAVAGFISSLFSNQGNAQVQQQLTQIYQRYGSFDPNIIAQKEQVFQSQGDPVSRSMSLDALSSLKNQVNQGGLDAIGKSQVAQATQGGQQAAAQNAGALQQQMQRENSSAQGPGSYVLGQVAGQGALQMGANQAMTGAAQAEQNRMAAQNSLLTGANQVGSLQQNLNQFNALAQQGVAERYAANQLTADQASRQNQLNALAGATNASVALTQPSQWQAGQTQAMGAGLGSAGGSLAQYLANPRPSSTNGQGGNYYPDMGGTIG